MEFLRTAAQRLYDETVALRRDFHTHPEIAFEEERTSREIARYLGDLGLEVRAGVGETGVVAVLDGAHAGPTVLARADIDALPIHEENDVPYRSTRPGAMHACGHDGHAAILLTVAKILAERRDQLAGRVVFVFQPAEEIVRGAEAMLADGALDGLEPVATVGLHLQSDTPVGTVCVSPGPTMANVDFFDVVVSGSGGHAASPHETIDPIVAASHLVTAAQTLVSRSTDPGDRAVLSFTAIEGGSAYNVIPGRVTLKGTLRTYDPAVRARLKERLDAVAAGVATATETVVDVGWIEGTRAVVNDAEITERIRALAVAQVGADHVEPIAPTMGGDDMSLWLERAPGCYLFVGARNEAAGITAPHHHPRFDIDEASLPIGVSLLASAVWELTGS